MALLRRDFLITNLICPFSWGCLQCKPHKVHISALIKPSFSDDSRVLQISGCYLRAVECHRRCSPPTVTLNAMIKWGWVLLSPSLKSYRWKGGGEVIKFVFLLTYVDLVFWGWVEWGQQNFRCKVYFSRSWSWSCLYSSFKVSGEITSLHLLPSPKLHIKIWAVWEHESFHQTRKGKKKKKKHINRLRKKLHHTLG